LFLLNDALRALLKLSVFSNILLIQTIQGIAASLTHDSSDSFSPFEKEIFKRLSADWTATRWKAFRENREKLESTKNYQALNIK
jgi:hypothetical protein